jgi:hypothetical protein
MIAAGRKEGHPIRPSALPGYCPKINSRCADDCSFPHQHGELEYEGTQYPGHAGESSAIQQVTSGSNLSAIYATIHSIRRAMRRTSLEPTAMQVVAGEHGAYRNWVH